MSKLSERLISYLLIIATLFGVVSIGALSVSAASATVVTTAPLRLRSSAEIRDDNFILSLGSAEELTLLRDSSDEWANVKRADGTTGYCSVNYLMPASGSTVKLTGKTNDGVNFRKEATTSSESMDFLSKGTEFAVVDNSDEEWVKVTIGSRTGYIYRSYTDLYLKIAPTTDISERPNIFDSSALGDLSDSYKGNTSPLSGDIALSDKKISIEAGSTYTLMVYVAGGVPAQSVVSFTSSDKSVATVTDAGLVKGVAEGTAVITATISDTGKKSTCNVTVTKAATKPTEPSTPTTPTNPTLPTEPTKPSEPPVTGSVKLNVSSASVSVGNSYHLIANRSVTWKSSDTSVATVSGGIVTALKEGTATITATSGSEKATCKITVTKATSSVTIDSTSVKISAGKTYFNKAVASPAATWSSSDTSVATVTNGYITAVSAGKAVITAENSKGSDTCIVTVTDAEPIRFAYSAPNTAAPGEEITLCAVTDKTRTAVKFDVTIGSSVKTVMATDKISDGNTYVWTGTFTTSTSGTHNVVAYSKKSDRWETCALAPDDAKTSVFVRKSSSLTSATGENRRATDKCITMISQFEGYSPCVYFDTLANNLPTLGYGRVVYVGESFYNDMTKKEAYAYLVETVNNGGYTTSINSYLNNNNIHRNQQQFDSLISFVYNLGAYSIANDSDFLRIFKASANQTATSTSPKDAYINDSDVNIRSGPSTSHSSLGRLAFGTTVTLIETSPKDGWYHLKTSTGITGYVYADYVTKGKLVSGGQCSLSNINKDDFTKLLLQYHHAGPGCVWGLLYRRIDELDIFYYGDYNVDGRNNKYGYSFSCSSDPSFAI